MSHARDTPSTCCHSMRASSGGSALSCSSERRVATASVVTQRSQLLGLMLGTQCADQFVEVAFHDLTQLVQGEIDAVIGDPPLREVVGANAFGTVTGAHQALALRGFLRLRFLLLLVFQARGQHLHGFLAVAML